MTVGRRLGILNIEKYIDALDQADRVDVIRDVYTRVQGQVIDQSNFFKLRGWNYDRSPMRDKRLHKDRGYLKAGEEAETS